MKKSAVTLLSLLCLTLVGCGEDKTSTSPVIPDSSASSESTSSSTSEKIVTTEEKIVNTLVDGFRSTEVLTTTEVWEGYEDEPVTTIYVMDLGIDPDFYQYRQYRATVNEEDNSLTIGSVDYAGTFTHVEEDGVDYLNVVALQIDNALHYEQLTDDEDEPYLWTEYGFENAFLELSPDSLVKESDTVYSVDIADVSSTFLFNLSSQVFGMDYGTINEFKITVDGEGNPVGYSGTYETIDEEFFGMKIKTDITFEATIDETGKDVIKGVTPLTGTADPDLTAALESLSGNNYEYTYQKYAGHYPDDGEFDASSSAVATVKGDNLKLTSYYKNGTINYNGGYYTVDGRTQEVVTIGDGYYKNGDAQAYTLSVDVLPLFDISPLFFDKTEDGVYVLNAEKYYTGSDQAYSYSLLNSSYITDLTITLNDDGSVSFVNYIPGGAHTAAEMVVETFSNIGGVTSDPIDTTTVHDTIAGLTWSNIFSYSSDLEDMQTFMGGKDNLDAVPTTQDNHSAFSYYFDADAGDFEIQYEAASTDEAEALLTSYDAITKAAGFSDPVIDETYGDHIYTKEVDGGTITVTAEATSFYGSVYFLIMPSFTATTTGE